MNIKHLYKFLSFKLIQYSFIGLIQGFLLFGVEILFIQVFQKTLHFIGILTTAEQFLPLLSQHLTNTTNHIVALILVGLLRAGLNFGQSIAQSYSQLNSLSLFRKRALASFFSPAAHPAASLYLRNQQVVSSGSFIAATQGALFNVTLLIFLSITLFKISIILTLGIGIILLVFFLPLKNLDSESIATGRVVNKQWATLDFLSARALKNKIFLKIFNAHELELHAANKHLEKALLSLKRIYIITGIKLFVPQAVGTLILAIIILALNFSKQFNITLIASSSIITFLYIFMRAVQTLSQTQINLNIMATHKGAITDFYSWWRTEGFDSPLALNNNALRSTEKVLKEKIGWELNDVYFSYGKNTNDYLFKNFSFSIMPGELLVIRGESGAGKSTLLSLLLGLISPQKGSIRLILNEKKEDLNNTKESLLLSIGYVGPESFIIEGTIRENLLYGSNPNYTDSDLKNVLAQSSCDFVWSLAHGLDHVLTEQGEGLSAGQKQRLSLARALLRKPKVLVLDEATSNLDQATEAKIIEFLATQKGQMTIIAVTHRDSLLQIADKILQIPL